MSTMTGPDYVFARNAVVASGSNALPALIAIKGNTNETWQVWLIAGICQERILRGAEIASITRKDWKKDPEYNTEWDKYRGGPGGGFGKWIVVRHAESSLWFYYLEFIWKETGEHSVSPHIREDGWRGVMEDALLSSPHVDLLARVLEERIRKDLEFRTFETQIEFKFLIDNKIHSSIPFILEVLPTLSLTDMQRRTTIHRLLRETARPDDLPLFDAYLSVRPTEMVPKIRNALESLRSNSTNAPTGGKP